MTAWNDFLAREGATLDNHAATFAGAPADGAALDTGAVAVPLVHLGLLHSAGPDSEVFLHNLFSNDVGNLAPQAVQWSSFNSPKGRMLASFLAWRASEGHHLLLAADIAQMMAKKLSMYILRSKVKLADISAERALVGVAGAQAGSCLQRAGLPLPAADMQTVADGVEVIRLDAQRFIVICAADAGAALFSRLMAAGAIKAGTDTWQLAMIRAGIPLITSATQEEFVAQMLNYELIGGVTFQKRCYPGQEIVARTQYLGKLKKRMYRVALPPGLQPQAGHDLYSPAFGEQSAGKLVNVVPLAGGGFEALAVLQSSCAESGEVHYGSTDGPLLDFLDLPYPLP